jgi:hypothetical protein
MNFSDRRFASRFNVAIPLQYRFWNLVGPGRATESINISKCGIYFASDSPLAPGAALRISLQMPKEITGVPSVEWNCLGHVVRLQPSTDAAEKVGVAVRLDYFEPLRVDFAV